MVFCSDHRTKVSTTPASTTFVVEGSVRFSTIDMVQPTTSIPRTKPRPSRHQTTSAIGFPFIIAGLNCEVYRNDPFYSSLGREHDRSAADSSSPASECPCDCGGYCHVIPLSCPCLYPVPASCILLNFLRTPPAARLLFCADHRFPPFGSSESSKM